MSGPAPVTRLAVDAGSLLTKIAATMPQAEESCLHTEPASPDRGRAALTAALEFARGRHAGAPGGGSLEVSLVVPDAWLDGSAGGARHQEDLRQLAEDQLGLTEVSWAGQLAAAAALAASRRGFTVAGRYLVCDVGGRGVRAATFEVTGRMVRPVAVHAAAGGGWLDFDAAVRTALAAGTDPGLATWYLSAAEQDRRARLVFDRARSDPEFLDARAYLLTGAAGRYELTAGQAAGCFAATADQIMTAAAAVLGGARPAAAVLTGGLAWFPLAHQALAEAAGCPPDVLGPEAAVLGALLLASGQAELAPHGLPPVTLPAHRVRDGLLEEISLTLPWTRSFAWEGSEPLALEGQELTLDVGRRRVTLPVPGRPAGPYRVGVRPSWSGTGVLVLRAPCADGATSGQAAPDRDLHVLPLNLQETPR